MERCLLRGIEWLESLGVSGRHRRQDKGWPPSDGATPAEDSMAFITSSDIAPLVEASGVFLTYDISQYSHNHLKLIFRFIM